MSWNHINEPWGGHYGNWPSMGAPPWATSTGEGWATWDSINQEPYDLVLICTNCMQMMTQHLIRPPTVRRACPGYRFCFKCGKEGALDKGELHWIGRAFAESYRVPDEQVQKPVILVTYKDLFG